jgi:hypothetical protein
LEIQMPRKEFKRPPGAPDGRKGGGKSTVKNSSTSPRKIMITAKFKKQAEEAVQYRLLGYTYGQIGAEMKCDPSYANRLVKWAMNSQPVDGVEELRQLQSNRIEAMLSAVLDRAISEGDGDAQDHARKSIELLAKLNGLFKPVEVKHSGEIEGGGTTVFIITPEDAKL